MFGEPLITEGVSPLDHSFRALNKFTQRSRVITESIQLITYNLSSVHLLSGVASARSDFLRGIPKVSSDGLQRRFHISREFCRFSLKIKHGIHIPHSITLLHVKVIWKMR